MARLRRGTRSVGRATVTAGRRRGSDGTAVPARRRRRPRGPLLRDGLVSGAPDPVAPPGDAQHHRKAGGGRLLEPGGHLLGVPGVDARVSLSGGQQHGGVSRPVDHVVVRGVGEERPELLGVLHGSELGHVERAVGGFLDPDHIGDPDQAGRGTDHPGVLGDECVHQQPSVRAAQDREPLWTGVPVLDEPLRGRREVIEDVLLARQVSADVPGMAELPSPAEDGGGVDASVQQPERPQRREGGGLVVSVTAVPVEDRRAIFRRAWSPSSG